jgi:uncharacterized protein (TIGR02145 family)
MKNVFFLLAISILILSCGGGVKEVKIGDQKWMSENLNVETFNNGDPIPQATSVDVWYKASYQDHSPVWCYYAYDEGKGKIYGKLYNWYAVTDPRGIAPEGWRIPTKSDFEKLQEYVKSNYDGKDCPPLKSKDIWKDDIFHTGTNETNFNALPGGFINIDGSFDYITKRTDFWTSTNSEDYEEYAYSLSLEYNYENSSLSSHLNQKEYGYSVRCIKE